MNRKHKLSKTVLEMKFMKKTKIQQEKVTIYIYLESTINNLSTNQTDAETENIEMLTDQKIKGGRHNNYVIERNWEFIEELKCPRFNYGMSQKPATETPVPASPKDEQTAEPPTKRAKHIRFN